jgi:hypothetical protein
MKKINKNLHPRRFCLVKIESRSLKLGTISFLPKRRAHAATLYTAADFDAYFYMQTTRLSFQKKKEDQFIFSSGPFGNTAFFHHCILGSMKDCLKGNKYSTRE